MFVLTFSKKRAFRAVMITLAVFVGIAVGIAAILTAIDTDAAQTKLPIYSVDRGDNKISLTFDCAWGNSNTDALLSILKEQGVYATFFVTGEFCDKFPDDVRRIAGAGHEIANHSDKHPHIKGININKLIEDTRECERKIQMITGKKPSLYRSPYGEYDTNGITTVEGLGYKFIQWSVDSIDWQEPDAATIIKRVGDKTVSGSILLFHNDLENTTDALPELLTRLRQAGFEFVKVSDLIYNEDYNIDNAGRQIRDVKVIVPAPAAYVPSPTVSEAIAVIAEKLTPEELSSLKNGVSPEIAAKVAPYLSAGQIRALSELSALSEEEMSGLVASVLEPELPIEPSDGEKYDAVAEGALELEDLPLYEQTDEENIPDLPGQFEGYAANAGKG